MGTLADLATSVAQKFGIPPGIFTSLIGQESGKGPGSPDTTWNPNAVGRNGEQGLGQLLPSTSSMLGVTSPFDPLQNLTGSAKYLAQQFQSFGNWRDALAAYNAGPGAVASAAGQAYAASVLGGAGLAGSGPGVQTVPPGMAPGGAATATSPATSGISLYVLALVAILLMIAIGVWAVVRG